MTKSRREEELELATQFVLAEPRAREFIWWVLEQCAIYSAPSVVNGETGIHIGRRVIGVSIINQLTTTDPTAYAAMMVEAHNRAERRKREENATSVDE
jgi:hypothetical protein